jgi:uncharacterized protein (DUF433 family)
LIVETALKAAGPGSVLAARPAGVTHVYVGPLTPSGRFIPRNRRAVCRAHTRRLGVTDPPRSSLHPDGAGVRLCARCSACLTRRRMPRGDVVGQVEQLLTRDDYRVRYGHLTETDLYLAAHTAETADELDVVGHLSLLLLGHRGCDVMVRRPDGSLGSSLHAVISHRRKQLIPQVRPDLMQLRRELLDNRRADVRAAREHARITGGRP